MKVLIVEDHPDSRDLLKVLLSSTVMTSLLHGTV